MLELGHELRLRCPVGVIRSSRGTIVRTKLKKSLDLTEIPVVDAHCHSYLETPKTLSTGEFARLSSIAAQPEFLTGNFVPAADQMRKAQSRLAEMYREQPFFTYMIRLLSELYRCRRDIEEIMKIRNSKAEHLDEYAAELFQDAKIRGLVLDGGYPPLKDDTLSRFPARVVKIFRLETFVNDLLAQNRDFEQLLSAFDSGIRDAVRTKGHRGLKTIIAYRTGLDIHRLEFGEARQDFEDAKAGRAELAWFGPKVKKLRDFLIIRALELSIELDVPMQFHTGVGDYEILLDKCNPALLFDLLKDDKLRHATVVLVHSGFPDTQNAAYMASVLPNVFADFSLTIPFLNPVGHERLKEILQVAPRSKLMYGSDGFNLPELFWLGAKVGKLVVARALDDLVRDGLYDEGEAERIARGILFENANKLFRLDLT